ncbi:MAG: bifunctional UDP-N-acetylglucosamine diphosphorylase/glucosamine-1-phosphate N-acetyltransferase GlmU [Pseudomonadota bacterium]
MSQTLHVVILAAGQGKRMKSPLPKVLAPLAGGTLLDRVLDRAKALRPEAIHVVVGHQAETVKARYADVPDLHWVPQEQQLGTGHAVMMALPTIPDGAQVLVLLGDMPLLETETLSMLCDLAGNEVAILTARVPDPAGYGRIVRAHDGSVQAIVEHRDADAATLLIDEVNSGLMAAPRERLALWLDKLDQGNVQGEYYLTDVVSLARQYGVPVQALLAEDPNELLGANDRWQLATLERMFQRRLAHGLCDAGATLADPARIDIRGDVSVEPGVFIDVNAVFEGYNRLGADVHIGPGCHLIDCDLAPGTTVNAHCVLEGMRTTGACDIGPFARLRPGTELAEGTRIGNFVETKNARLGQGSKANHLSYVGDAEVGADVNIGAGTITCNYDGANKHTTVIGDGAFIGSDSQLVAPVTVGPGATIGAGTTVTKDAPDNELTVTRRRQMTIPGWKRPTKQES